MGDPWRCPNTPRCEHPGLIHDIYEPGDPWPTCCAEGCRCGHPGDAVCVRDADGTVTVSHADPVILVSRELLDNIEPWAYDREREVLQLDTAGKYRYGYLRPGPDRYTLVFGRLSDHSGEAGSAPTN